MPRKRGERKLSQVQKNDASGYGRRMAAKGLKEKPLKLHVGVLTRLKCLCQDTSVIGRVAAYVIDDWIDHATPAQLEGLVDRANAYHNLLRKAESKNSEHTRIAMRVLHKMKGRQR